MRIALISCSKIKRNGTHKAKDLYSSPLFVKQLEYAKSHADRIYILSAKYGLLNLEDRIDNYDLTLNNMSKREQMQWAYNIWIRLKREIEDTDEILWLTGNNYSKYLSRVLKNKQVFPLDRLSVGKRLQWLNGTNEKK